MNVVFRVDASTLMGAGHVMRCLTLANELRRYGVETGFVARAHNGHLNKLIIGQGHELHTLSSHENIATFSEGDIYAEWLGVPWERDAEETIEEIRHLHIDWVVVDHYAIDEKWLKKIRPYVKQIFVIDDLANRRLDCDVLLDQTYSRREEEYQGLVNEHCKLLVGSEYALLRSEFSRLRPAAIEKRKSFSGVERILISMGANDPCNLTEDILDELEGVVWHKKPFVDVVLGSQAPHLRAVIEKSKLHSLRVNISVEVTDMARRMLDADLAIGASGATSWERCCLGLPTITFVTAENQRFVAKALVDAEVVLECGRDDCADGTLKQLVGLLDGTPEKWKELSAKAFMVTDGMGANRVVQHIVSMKARDGLPVYLRTVTISDAELLYKWQSDPRTRRYSNNSSIPSFEEHVSWLNDQLKKPASVFQMIMHGNAPSGVIRLDPAKDSTFGDFIVSIYVSPSKYRLGLGKISVTLLCEMVEGCRLLAQVHEGNAASHALFSSCGFVRVSESYYSKQI